jgi:hypothetical protein
MHMIRTLTLTLALALALSTSGCGDIKCGPGTKQVQDQKTGNTVCVPADQQGTSIPCSDDLDAGTTIVAGKCVSLIHCASGQPMKLPDGTYECEGGGGPPMCHTPATGTFCVEGTIHDFVTGAKASIPIHVSAYDPQAFLSGGATPLTNGDDANVTDGTYVFQDVPVPATNLVAIAATDGTGMLVLGGAGATIAAGGIYKIDGYIVQKSVVDGWQTTVGAGAIDYSQGAYVACFFSDASQAAQNNYTVFETHPIAGVGLVTATGGAIPTARYLDPSLDKINLALTATGVKGCAVAPANGIASFSGSGGGVTKWEVRPGGSAAGVVFVDRYHPAM